jgi:cobalamin synthase
MIPVFSNTCYSALCITGRISVLMPRALNICACAFHLDQLLDVFGDATLCGRAADGFSVILKDSDILNQKNHSITRVS